MSLRYTRLFRSAIMERHYTGTVTDIFQEMGKILCDSPKTHIDPFRMKDPIVKSSAAVHAEGLRDMFVEYSPCEEKAEAPLKVEFTEDSLARGQVMRGIRKGYRVRFDVIEITDNKDVAEDELVHDRSESTKEAGPLTSAARSKMEIAENLLYRRKGDAQAVPQRYRKQYMVSNLMVISSVEGVASHKAFAKARSELSLV